MYALTRIVMASKWFTGSSFWVKEEASLLPHDVLRNAPIAACLASFNVSSMESVEVCGWK